MSEEQAPVTEEVAQEQTEEVSRETTEQAGRPDIIPEKFWNAETGEINVGELAHSYNNLEKMVSGKQDAMREQVMAELTEEARSQAPEEPSGYNLPPLVEGVTEEMVESNPTPKKRNDNWWNKSDNYLKNLINKGNDNLRKAFSLGDGAGFISPPYINY